ncbi:MAG: DUF1552 domain-containing protein [Verrucomicrobiota bacterium]
MFLPALEGLQAAAPASAKAPLRMAFLYIPNGVNLNKWRTKGEGKDFELSPTLQPLESSKGDIQVLTGLDHDKGFSNGDGAGDHARANSSFLTGVQIKKTAGADIRAGVSVDQIAAQAIGRETYLPSLELSCDQARQSGRCDSGYACAYQYNMSWRSETQPMAPENNPRLVFERLFGGFNPGESREAREKRMVTRRSILDFVLEDAKGLRRQLGRTDQRKLDEYLTAVREMEARIEKAETHLKEVPAGSKPTGIPEDYESHLRIMLDLLALAFETDTTRVSSFMFAHDGSNRSFAEIGVPQGHHSLSHHRHDQERLANIAKIDRFYATQFAYFLEQLKAKRDLDGSRLIDNTMVVYGGGLSDGNYHDHNNLPVVLAGGKNAGLQTGRHKVYNGAEPMTNLYLSLLDRMNIEAERIGDSTRKLSDI